LFVKRENILSKPVQIAASILAADFARLGEQIQGAESAGVDLIHVDVMDGRFVPNITLGPLIVEAARRSTQLPLDVHLMIVEPDQYIGDFASAGADRISVHWEACPNLHRTLQRIREAGCQAGIAINPHTPASLLSEVVHLLDVVIVMTVNPGFGGQAFLPETLPKIAALREMMAQTGREIDIEVDGGINATTASTAVQAGANVLIAGSAIYSDKHSIDDGVRAIRQAAGR
jgi:ribulose-phosphate 3-epimerase